VIQQPIVVGCQSASNEDLELLLETGAGISIPGCLTSLDEERETWTARSLRVLILKELLLFWDWGRTKDFGGTRLHRLHHAFLTGLLVEEAVLQAM
jgi:hypothetical protein